MKPRRPVLLIRPCVTPRQRAAPRFAVCPVALLVMLFILLALPVTDPSTTTAEAKEVLPPSAYLNRTLYPPLQSYPIKPSLSLGILSDVQYADQDELTRRHFRLSLTKLEHAVNEMNANRTHLDMVLHLGDLVDHSIQLYLAPVLRVLKQLRYPLYHLLGNHDFLGTDESKFSQIHKMLGMPGRYYSLNAGTNQLYRLIMLDGNDIALYSTVSGSPERKLAYEWKYKLKSQRRRNANKFNGALGESQVDWLKKELSSACNASQRAVLFLHHPMRPVGEPTNLWNDLEMVPIVTSYPCLVAVFNGHAHKFLYDFHHTTHRNVHFVTFGGMVQSPFTSWGFADFYEQHIHVHGLVFGRAIDFRYDITAHGATPSGLRDRSAEAVSREDQITPAVVVVSSGPSSPQPTTSLLSRRQTKDDMDDGRTSRPVLLEVEEDHNDATLLEQWLWRRLMQQHAVLGVGGLCVLLAVGMRRRLRQTVARCIRR